MKVFKTVVLVSAISVVALVGCSKTTPTATQPSVEPSVSSAVTQPTPAATEYADLVDVVTRTKASVDAGDFEKAEQTFEGFETVWSQVEDGIKAKSLDHYDLIEEDMDRVMESLEAKDQATAIATLQTLTEHINSIPQA